MSYRTQTLNARFMAKFELLQAAVQKLGAHLDSPSGDGFIWRLTVDRKCVTFLGETFPFNTAPAWRLARDKLATYQVLEANDLSIPKGIAYFHPTHIAGLTHVEERRLVTDLENQIVSAFGAEATDPTKLFIVKPADASGGAGVRVCTGLHEVVAYAPEIFRWGHCGLVQEFVHGSEWRIVIFDGEVILAYQRQSLTIRGDGRTSVQGIIAAQHPMDTAALERVLKLSGGALTPNTVLAAGDEVSLLLEAHNLSQGAKPLLHNPPDSVVHAAVRAHDLLGLQFSGSDIKLTPEGKAVVLEVNGNPGFLIFREFYPEQTARFVSFLAEKLVQYVRMHGK